MMFPYFFSISKFDNLVGRREYITGAIVPKPIDETK